MAAVGSAQASISVTQGYSLLRRTAQTSLRGGRSLELLNLHTGERVTATYWENGRYLPDGLAEINNLLRDHRTGDISEMDPELLDLLVQVRDKLETNAPFHIISGYRSPKTNAMLASHSNGVAKKSFHMQGKAVDIRVPSRSSSSVRQVARTLQRGGVGYYPRSDFVHVDTGNVRYW